MTDKKIFFCADHPSTTAHQKNREGETALMDAAKKGHFQCLKHLLRAGAGLETRDHKTGKTALSWAALTGHEKCVRTLLDQGASKETQDVEGNTPLMHAIIRDSEGCIRTLLLYKAQLKTKNYAGEDALALAKQHHISPECQTILEEAAQKKNICIIL